MIQKCDTVQRCPRSLIIGCGYAGNVVVGRLYDMGMTAVKTVAINTDKQRLDSIRADENISIDETLIKELGTDVSLEIGEKADEIVRVTLNEVFEDRDLVFVTADMDSSIVTEIAPIIAEIAKKNGATVIWVVSIPFRVDKTRTFKADRELKELLHAADTVIVLDTNRLLKYVPNLQIERVFSVMNQLIAEAIKNIIEIITKPSIYNIDYSDIKDIVEHGGISTIIVEECQNNYQSVNEMFTVFNYPLIDVDYRDATGCIIHITGGSDMCLYEAESIAGCFTYELSACTNVIWGANIRSDYEGKIRFMAIMVGLQ